jgi:hypothetical protein
MSRLLVSLVAGSLSLVALAGPHEDYIAAVGKYKVEGLSTTEDLRNLKVESYLELKGRVVGSVRGVEGAVTMIVDFGDVSQTIDVKTAPDWLVMGVSDVRLIVKATPVATQIIPELELVASLPEADMALVEQKLLAEAERRAEEERKKADLAMRQMQVQGKSRGGTLDFGRTPPDGNKFTGIIGGGGSASSNELTQLVPDYVALILDRNKSIGASDAQLIAECVLAYSSVYGVDARLVMSIIQHESNFNPRVTSHAGAQGLGQLMPDTWRSLGISDPFDIVQNVYGTVRTIRGHLERQGKESRNAYEQVVRALAAYNAGPGAVKKYGGLPPYAETEAYVERVMRTYLKLSGKSQ